MSKLKCVIHYKHLDTYRDSLTVLSEKKLKKFNDSRDARQTSGGDYLHREQVEGIPENLNPEKHAAHRKCYQKFTQAVSVLKRKT